jgi:protein-export membrane protein SecD
VGDRLDVRLGADADINAALDRIQRLGGDRLVVTQGGYAVVQVKVSDNALAGLKADALGPSLEAARRRLEAADLEATVGELAPDRLCMEAPGFGAGQLESLAELLTRPGVLSFNFVDDEADRSTYEPGVEKNGRVALPDDSLDGALQVIYVDAVVRGSDLSGAVAIQDDRNQPAISFQLHPSGQSKFGKATTDNIGKAFAIVLDDRILTSPRIMSPILAGSGQITGQFTREEAERLAVILRSGALPARLKLIEIGIVTRP